MSDGPGSFADKVIKSGKHKEAVQAYLATTTYVDTQMGRVLDGRSLVPLLKDPKAPWQSTALTGLCDKTKTDLAYITIRHELGRYTRYGAKEEEFYDTTKAGATNGPTRSPTRPMPPPWAVRFRLPDSFAIRLWGQRGHRAYFCRGSSASANALPICAKILALPK